MATTVDDLYSQGVSLTKHERVYRELLDRVRSGDWAEGSRVPSESELAAEFDASRGTIRQALSRLRDEGVISGGRGVQPTVQRLVPQQSFSSFMSFTEWARSAGREPGQRTLELARRACPADLAVELELAPDAPVVQYVRLRLLDGHAAMVERSTFPLEVARPLFDADLDSASVYRTLTEAGRRPARARHIIDAVAANRLDSELLEVPVGTPLLRQRRLVHDADGNPFEWAEDRYLPAEANFVIENTVGARSALAQRQIAETHPRTEPAAPGDHSRKEPPS